jgi:glycosyltransferase involved in cell wall biosynthesis
LNECQAILPNSRIEVEVLRKIFSIRDDQTFFIIPNAADKSFINATPELFWSKYNIFDFVLCVGRIEERKNQLSLIRALSGIGNTLVLIGGADRRRVSADYFKFCKKEAGNNVLFIDWIEGEYLSSAYAAAKLHALVSWYETPGLTSLEAGLAGCNIVTTNRGSTKEYFSDYAWYCDPSDITSIRKSIVEAYETEPNPKLKQHILDNFTWEKAAEKTLNAYCHVLDRKKLKIH